MFSRFVFNEAFDISVILFYDYGPLNYLVSAELFPRFSALSCVRVVSKQHLETTE